MGDGNLFDFASRLRAPQRTGLSLWPSGAAARTTPAFFQLLNYPTHFVIEVDKTSWGHRKMPDHDPVHSVFAAPPYRMILQHRGHHTSAHDPPGQLRPLNAYSLAKNT